LLANISIENETRNQLRSLGRKQQTYNDIIKELLEKAEKSLVNSEQTTIEEG
jgi:hypothetical protein